MENLLLQKKVMLLKKHQKQTQNYSRMFVVVKANVALKQERFGKKICFIKISLIMKFIKTKKIMKVEQEIDPFGKMEDLRRNFNGGK
ncbi:hypothetical protein [Leptospira interrogans]|uniref:hypothetical protein n=1 Tax=Leptospira interrogans TaxID=173 RepID=UPI0009E536EF|nr:hypothetical protein [Leptospira interrogans]